LLSNLIDNKNDVKFKYRPGVKNFLKVHQLAQILGSRWMTQSKFPIVIDTH